MNSKTKKVLVPLVAIVFGFLLGAIIMLPLATTQFGVMKTSSFLL
ncbi:hypothetical protein ICE98_02644 [Lactococcus lactis]|nr:hypothetical protein [Lactococcus lactis]